LGEALELVIMLQILAPLFADHIPHASLLPLRDDQPRREELREELLEPPAVTKPVPGHNTSLMKTFQAGRDNWHAEQNRDATNRGDSWPTT